MSGIYQQALLNRAPTSTQFYAGPSTFTQYIPASTKLSASTSTLLETKNFT